jgi:hypothetical protein
VPIYQIALDIGRLGRDAELRYTPNGDAVCNLALACEYGRKGQDGKRPTPMDRRYALGQTGRDNGALPSQGAAAALHHR